MTRLQAVGPPVRLILKSARHEVFTVVASAIVGALVMLALILLIDGARDAIGRCPTHPCAADEELVTLAGLASPPKLLALVLPIAAGIVIGAPLVAAEIEHGTATLAWSIAPSRGRWYVERVLVLGAIVAIVGVTLGIAMTALTQALHPGLDLGRSFEGYEVRWSLAVSNALLAFGVAVLVGSLTGRVVPGILLSAIVFGFLVAGMRLGFDTLNRAEAIELASWDSGGLVLTTLIRDPETGVLLTPAEAFGPGSPGLTEFEVVPIGLPGDRVGLVVAREAAVSVGLGLIATAAAAIVVGQRRPV